MEQLKWLKEFKLAEHTEIAVFTFSVVLSSFRPIWPIVLMIMISPPNGVMSQVQIGDAGWLPRCWIISQICPLVLFSGQKIYLKNNKSS